MATKKKKKKSETIDETRLELWEGGEIRSGNIGPARGDHLLGRVDGPGLYLFVARNAGGKSQHLGLLGRIQDEKLLRSDVPITDGEVDAYLQIAEARVTFRRSARGDAREPKREGVETLPTIEEIPQPIDELITGGHIKGAEARARHRLKALLSYAPVESRDELVVELCDVMRGRFLEEITVGVAAAWADLQREVSGRQKRFREMSLEGADQIEAWLLEQSREGILDDHERLVDRLNALGNVAEKIVAVQAERVAAAEARMGAAVDASGIPAAMLVKAPDPAETQDELQVRQERAWQLRDGRRRFLEEHERQEQVRASHGEKPDRQPEVQALRAAKTRIARAISENADGDVELRRAEVALEAAKVRKEATEQERQSAHAGRQAAEEALNRIDVRLESWEATAALLAQTLEGPSVEDVAKAQAAVERFEEAFQAAKAADVYRAAAVEHKQEEDLQVQLLSLAEDYREAKKGSWARLGEIVTDELALPWLAVDELEIQLRYDPDGTLRKDPSTEDFEVRDLDDADRVSAGELHEAMLQLMLSRREKLGGILIVPWQIVAALDEERLSRLATEAEAAKLVVFSERPRRTGDPEDLMLERVAS